MTGRLSTCAKESSWTHAINEERPAHIIPSQSGVQVRNSFIEETIIWHFITHKVLKDNIRGYKVYGYISTLVQ
jgi:hypothetical protein